MKKLYLVLGLALASAACQPQAAQITAATTAPEAPVATAQPTSLTKAAPLLPPQPVLTDSLTPGMRATLQQVNMANLLLAPEPGRVGDYQSVLDGFFGSNPQRLSLAILKATRDSLQPALYHVMGKIRYKQRVYKFKGLIKWTKLADYYDQGLLLSQGDDDLDYVQDTTRNDGGSIMNANAYSAWATFSFKSADAVPASLTGQVLLDFWVNNKGKLGTMRTPFEGQILKEAPTRGSGLVLTGVWQEKAANSHKPFIISRDIFLLSPEFIADLGIGDRGSEINPRYAKKGWNTYWENDEWWADSPKPSLNL